MEGSTMDGTMLSGGPSSFDALQLHQLSRQHPIMVGPISVAHPHVNTGQEANGHRHCLAHGNPRNPKAKLSLSDEDERSEDGTEAHMGKKGSSLWHRMKWTDDIVRLLINVVSYVGEDADCTNDGNKRKAGILQKKGKWKSVSRVMMEKGYNVSPQQCEDKFNDLNKRYKRLNDVLGRGTACTVVENPSLLESMDHLSPKVKDDVRKILSSKHLFYREMCAYHNGGRIHVDSEHSVIPAWGNLRSGERNEVIRPMTEEMDDEENEDEDTEEDEEEDEENDENEGGLRIEDGVGEFTKRPRMIQGMYFETLEGERPNTQYNFNQEMMGVLQDGTRTEWQKRQWIRNRTMQLAEQKVGIQARAFELEQQCLKWKRLRSKKDREFDRLKLENERMKLETEQLKLQLKKKELGIELKRSEASISSRAALHMEQMHRMEQHDIHSEEQVQ